MSVDVDLQALRPILADLGLAVIVSLTEMQGGSTPTFRVDLDDGTAVVLKTYDEVRGKLPTREAYASHLLRDVDFPMTRYLALDESRARLPYPFAITNFLPGEPVGTFRDKPGVEDAYRETGALLRKLHAVPMAGYGALSESGIRDGVPSNEVQKRRRAEYAFSQFRKRGGDDSLAQRLEAIVAERLERATVSTGPVFAHDDLHPNNVLAVRDADGKLRLAGLIDFGNARADDAVSDLAKTLFCSEHDAPGSTPFIREGYGPIDHPDPEVALWLYTLLHRVTMWCWLRYVGVIRDGEHNALIDDLQAMTE